MSGTEGQQGAGNVNTRRGGPPETPGGFTTQSRHPEDQDLFERMEGLFPRESLTDSGDEGEEEGNVAGNQGTPTTQESTQDDGNGGVDPPDDVDGNAVNGGQEETKEESEDKDDFESIAEGVHLRNALKSCI